MTSPTDIILYRTVQSLDLEVVYEKKKRPCLFSGSRKFPTLSSTVHWNLASLVSHWNAGRALGLGFFCPHWTPMMDSIYLTNAILPRLSREGYVHLLYWNTCTLSSSDVIVMLKCHHQVKLYLSVFSDFWKLIFK